MLLVRMLSTWLLLFSSTRSDWVTVKVMWIDDKKVKPDTLSWVKFSGISWTNDSKGFFYSRYPAPKSKDGSRVMPMSHKLSIPLQKMCLNESVSSFLEKKSVATLLHSFTRKAHSCPFSEVMVVEAINKDVTISFRPLSLKRKQLILGTATFMYSLSIHIYV